MKANELRINDYFIDTFGHSWCSPNSIQIIKTIGKDGVNEWHDMGTSGCCKFEDMKPVPITPELLLSKGFERSDFYGTYTNGSDYCIVYRSDEGGEDAGWYIQNDKESDAWCLSVNNEPLQYIHQLQNFYFDLTGNELLKI